jgi:hypothetical protein
MSNVRLLLERYAEAVGGHVARDYRDVGGYYINKNANGYKIEVIVNSGGGCDDVSKRGSKRDLWDFMHAGLALLRERERQYDVMELIENEERHDGK